MPVAIMVRKNNLSIICLNMTGILVVAVVVPALLATVQCPCCCLLASDLPISGFFDVANVQAILVSLLQLTFFLPKHRVGRELSFFSSRRNWDSPNPSPAGERALPPFGSGGRVTLAG
jgi:hypothetical protein